MKARIAVAFLVVLLVALTLTTIVFAEDTRPGKFAQNGAVTLGEYAEVSCDHHKWIDVPGLTGEDAVWLKVDPGIVIAKETQNELSFQGTAFIISHSSIAVTGTALNNTWGCRYGGSYFPSQDRVDEIIGDMAPSYCIYVDEEGTIESISPVNGKCILPAEPVITPTPTLTSTATIEPTVTDTPVPTVTVTPIPDPGISLGGGINTNENWYAGVSGSELQIVTGLEYDVVSVTYDNPGAEGFIHLYTDQSRTPVITKSTVISNTWNSSNGYWEIRALANNEGIIETVTRMPAPGLLPTIIKVEASGYENGPWISWSASISSGSLGAFRIFLPLIIR